MKVMKVSERFACRVTGQNRTTHRHPGPPCGFDPDNDDAFDSFIAAFNPLPRSVCSTAS